MSARRSSVWGLSFALGFRAGFIAHKASHFQVLATHICGVSSGFISLWALLSKRSGFRALPDECRNLIKKPWPLYPKIVGFI